MVTYFIYANFEYCLLISIIFQSQSEIGLTVLLYCMYNTESILKRLPFKSNDLLLSILYTEAWTAILKSLNCARFCSTAFTFDSCEIDFLLFLFMQLP